MDHFREGSRHRCCLASRFTVRLGIEDRLIIVGRASPLFSHAVGLMSVVAVMLLRWLLWPVIGDKMPFLFLWFPLVLAGRLGGLWPIVSTTVAASLAAAYFLFVPRFSLAINDPGEVIGLILFAAQGGLIALFFEKLSGAQRIADEKTDELRRQYGQLQDALAVEQRSSEERRRVEESLRQSEGRYRVLFEQSLAGVLLTGEDGTIHECNQAFADILGYESCAQVKARRVQDFYFRPEDREELLAQLRQQGGLSNREISFRHRLGTPVWVLANVSMTCFCDGCRCIHGSIVDITERKRTEERLSRDALLLASVQDSIIVTDLDGIVTYWNEGATRLFGWTADEMLRRPLTDRVPAEGRAAMTAVTTAIRDGQDFSGEWQDYRKDGSRVWIDAQVRRINDVAGHPIALLGLSRDISERKRVTAERDRLFDLSLDMLCVAGLDGYFRRVNPAFSRILGYTAEELCARPFLDFVHPEDRTATQAEVEKLARGIDTVRFENRYRTRDGSYRWLSWATPAPEPGSQSLYAVARDVTTQKTLEARLRQAQKMEAIGQLAGGIAHDFNNLMTVVIGFADIILGQLPSESPLRTPIQQIKKSGERAASLTQQLLAFSSKQIVQPQLLNLNNVVTDAVPMLKRTLGEDVELTTILEPTLGRVHADPGQLVQVVLNLAVNARDAMRTGGKLTLETRNVKVDAADRQRPPNASVGRYVLLAVTDTGVGMSKETQAHIFEPFFTTEFGQGTGLGLAAVYGIVMQSGGHIEVCSEQDVGTTFKVYLPRVDEAAKAGSSSPGLATAPQGSETVLLVEDEEDVRGLAALVLKESGYTVLEAANGAEALRVAERHGGPIHLLVTDVVMPQMGGRQTAERLQDRYPTAKVLYVSGYTDDTAVRHGIGAADSLLLQKPFSPAALAQKVRGVLDSPK